MAAPVTDPIMRIGIEDLPPDEYHADPCEVPSLNKTVAWEMITRSPAHARLKHPRLAKLWRPPTPEQDVGTIAHRLMLGRGAEFAEIDARDWRTKAAKEARDEALDAGLVPVLSHKLERYRYAADRVRQGLADHGIDYSAGMNEQSMFWVEHATDGTPVQCRGMLDHIGEQTSGLVRIRDLKTTADASPASIQRTIFNLGYHVQAAAYSSGLAKVYPDWDGRVEFWLDFAEMAEPFCVVPVQLAGDFRRLGDLQWQQTIDLWANCMRTGHWPGYVTEPIRVEAPPWALKDAMYEEGSEATE